MSTPIANELTPHEKFDALLTHVVSIPKKEILRREKAYKKQKLAKKASGMN